MSAYDAAVRLILAADQYRALRRAGRDTPYDVEHVVAATAAWNVEHVVAATAAWNGDLGDASAYVCDGCGDQADVWVEDRPLCKREPEVRDLAAGDQTGGRNTGERAR